MYGKNTTQVHKQLNQHHNHGIINDLPLQLIPNKQCKAPSTNIVYDIFHKLSGNVSMHQKRFITKCYHLENDEFRNVGITYKKTTTVIYVDR